MLRIRAGRVYPVTAPPIEDGAVLVQGSEIVAVGPNASVPAPEGIEHLGFPGGALVPGLVNCHTHLELTGLAGQVNEREFSTWIRRIRALKDGTTPEQFCRAAEQGLRLGWAGGVTCIAETGSTGAAFEALHALGGRGVYYHEVFGPDPAQRDASMTELRDAVSRLAPRATGEVRLGVSPHAPYTVSAALYRAVAEFARVEGLPLAVHIAESPAEMEFVRDGTGPFADALRARGIAIEPHRATPIEYLTQLGVLQRGVLCIHCVQANDRDLERLEAAGASIAHCPRSNSAHSHGRAPLAQFRAAGIPVGLGTDSIVSIGDLELWREADAAGLRGEEALRMLTLEGARALGLDSEIGSIDVGKQADLAVFPSAVFSTAGVSAAVSPTALFVLVAGRIVQR
ncbi:MAG TPA: amidohydrolase family protein [Gemmatimonadales bacterium]|nr:amidohydrolase family protein [Gemmatimonadales bacterium]